MIVDEDLHRMLFRTKFCYTDLVMAAMKTAYAFNIL